MSKSRRVDGRPETKADKEFFDLRESGYTGPIKWADDGSSAVKADPNSEEAEILRELARRRGEKPNW